MKTLNDDPDKGYQNNADGNGMKIYLLENT